MLEKIKNKMINLKEKKILVTGGAGFIGKHVVDNLIKNYVIIATIKNEI